jgi:lysophospholipase L1-like esterase
MVRTLWNTVSGPLSVGAVIGTQMVQAIQRPDLETLADQDPTGTFGDASLPDLRIVVLGDSTVTCPGVVPLDDCWARRTALALSERFHVDLLSLAIGGSKVAAVRDEQVHRAILAGGDLVIVCVGGNDALRGTPVRRFESAYSDMLATLTSGFPAVAVCGVGDLGTIPRLPALARGAARIRARAIDHAIGRVASAYGVPKTRAWGPEYVAFEHDPAVWAGDLFHASAEGHALYADATTPLAEEALRRSRLALPGSDGSST